MLLVAGPQEIGVQRMHLASFRHRAAGTEQRLGQHLAPEDMTPAFTLVACLEQAVVERLQVEVIEELLQLLVHGGLRGGEQLFEKARSVTGRTARFTRGGLALRPRSARV